MVESFGKSLRESTSPPGCCTRSMSAAFHGPSFGSKVSRWLAPPLRLMKIQARAEPRGLTAGRLVVVAASPRTPSSAADAAPNRKCLRVKEACPPQVFQFCFILIASVIKSEIELVEQSPLQIAEPLISRTAAPLHYQLQLPL